MDGKHPNRKKDKSNPYTLSIENDTYYISFIDGQGVFHKQKISAERESLNKCRPLVPKGHIWKTLFYSSTLLKYAQNIFQGKSQTGT